MAFVPLCSRFDHQVLSNQPHSASMTRTLPVSLTETDFGAQLTAIVLSLASDWQHERLEAKRVQAMLSEHRNLHMLVLATTPVHLLSPFSSWIFLSCHKTFFVSSPNFFGDRDRLRTSVRQVLRSCKILDRQATR